MLFCKQCGGALNLFESSDEEVCWHCVRRRENDAAHEPAKSPPPQIEPEEDSLKPLVGATFSVQGNNLVLTAEEGWVLWSGPLDKPVPFQTIVDRSQQIYRIRQRRKNRKN